MRAANVAPLAREIAAAIAGAGESEIIFVDDGSTDDTAAVLKSLQSEIPALRVIQHGRNIGQSRAIRTGVRAARGEDPDRHARRRRPERSRRHPRLLALFAGRPPRGWGLSGVRLNRKDPAKKRWASRTSPTACAA